MGLTVGNLGSASIAAAEGPAVEEGPAAAMSAAEEPVATREVPTAGEVGPWRTRCLKE